MKAGFRPGMRLSHGFTLIEVIVVVVIMGLLAGVALLSMSTATPGAGSDCATRLPLWLTEMEAEAARRDETLYVAIERRQLRAARLLKNEDGWLSEAVDQLAFDDCRLTRPARPVMPRQIPELMAEFSLAVTADGDWSTPAAEFGPVRLTMTDRHGTTRTITPGE